jgi:hypothetical protein
MVEVSTFVQIPLAGGAPRPFSLSVSTEDDTAGSPADFEALRSQIIQFNTGDTVHNFTLTIANDGICEVPNENFIVNITVVGGIQPIFIITHRAHVIINDMNEPECVPTVSFSSETYVAAESAGSVEVCVILNIPYSFALEFTINARDIGSATAGVDFVGGEYKTYILPGSTDRCINITILNDNIALEENENFAVEIAMASVPSITSTAEIIITDSNVATVALEETLYRVTEAGGSVQVCVRVVSPISGCPIASAFVVSLYTNDDDADSVTDYSAVAATLSFPPCSTLQCVTIAITDDSIPEPDESFSLILERSPGLDSRITLASSTGSVLIFDDDDFMCTARGVPEVTVIDCTGNQPGSSLQCSFNEGQLHSCML